MNHATLTRTKIVHIHYTLKYKSSRESYIVQLQQLIQHPNFQCEFSLFDNFFLLSNNKISTKLYCNFFISFFYQWIQAIFYPLRRVYIFYEVMYTYIMWLLKTAKASFQLYTIYMTVGFETYKYQAYVSARSICT